MLKAFRRLLVPCLLLAAALLSGDAGQAAIDQPACCQSCLDQFVVCANTCGCYIGRGLPEPCSPAYSACLNQCKAAGITCPIIL
jgi:hypothetical protein